jgi:predicted short-subunit dehydrogenase-like oxidoreductase (DUF2520 family)
MVSRENIAVIGAGTVGSALAAEVNRRLYRVSALFTKHHHRSVRLPSGIRSVYRGTDLRLLPADIRVVLVTVNDDEIGQVVEKLAAIPGYHWKRVVVLHVSGALSSRIFSKLKKRGAECGSLHPLQSFPRSLPVQKRGELFYNISWGIEGDPKAVREARKIVTFFRGRVLVISPAEKALYHAACVCVSNYLVTLLNMAEEIAVKSGVDRKAFLRAAVPLISTTLKNALDSTPVKALTGPIERGDEKTIQHHVEGLRRLVPGLLDTYAALGAETVTLALKKGTLKKEIAANLYRLFYTL